MHLTRSARIPFFLAHQGIDLLSTRRGLLDCFVIMKAVELGVEKITLLGNQSHGPRKLTNVGQYLTS
jgi:hypothetical protein